MDIYHHETSNMLRVISQQPTFQKPCFVSTLHCGVVLKLFNYKNAWRLINNYTIYTLSTTNRLADVEKETCG